MKVKCINDSGWEHTDKWYRKNWWSKKTKRQARGPKIGDTVTVERDQWNNGQLYYFLTEWPNGYSYNSKGFEPIEEEYQQVKYSEVIKEKAPCAN